MVLQLGLIGYPINHSLSPWIHQQFLSRAEIEGSYQLIEYQSYDLLQEHISHLKNINLKGFNVTVPYKEKIIPFLNDIDEEAKMMEAVNTVLNKDGEWIGYNTDGKGYLRSLKERFPDILMDTSLPILIIGAGGAAKGIYYGLIKSGFTHIDITNRTLENAEEIAGLKNEKIQTTCYSIETSEELLCNYSLIIQTTSVGMKPEENKSVMSLEKLNPNTIVSDIVYQPLNTKFLKEAKEKGALIHFGHSMLLYQAQFAFEIWTGHRVIVDGIDTRLKSILEEK